MSESIDLHFIELAIDDYARMIQQHAERQATIALRTVFTEQRDAFDESQRIDAVQQLHGQRTRLLTMIANVAEGREVFAGLREEEAAAPA